MLQNSLWNGVLTFSNHNFVNYAAPISHVSDGTSKTVMVGEVSESLGGANFLFVDGSARFVNEVVDAVLYQAWGTRAGGEATPGDD